MTYTIKNVFISFFKLGLVSFGGYMALISVVHQKFVERDKHVPDKLLADMVALSTFLPGPVAVNVVSALGFYLRGWQGAVAAFAGVLLPAFIFMGGLFYLYERFIEINVFTSFFKGATSVVVAIIFSVALTMAKKVKRISLLTLLIPIAFALLFFFPEFWSLLLILLSAGLIGWVVNRNIYDSTNRKNYLGWTLPILLLLAGIIYFLPTNTIYLDLARTFSTVSVTLFGGGYVMIPMLNDLIVAEKQWLTQTEFIDAIALGQITPGPILISAAFVGFKQAGFWGGLISTLAIFCPSAVLMIVMFNNLSTWLGNRHVRAFFDGLRMAVIGMIFYSGVVLFLGQGVTVITAGIGIIALGLLIVYKISPIHLILGGGLFGVFGYLTGFKL